MQGKKNIKLYGRVDNLTTLIQRRVYTVFFIYTIMETFLVDIFPDIWKILIPHTEPGEIS